MTGPWNRDVAKAVGIYDPITAVIASNQNASHLWLSSYCYSASQGFPDFALLPFSSEVGTICRISRVATAPLIVDIDHGYASTEHSIEIAKTLAAAGAFGLCVEDKKGPKRSSLYQQDEAQLLEAECFADLIRGVKSSCPDLHLIARLEGLNYGTSDQEIEGKIEAVADHCDAVALHLTKPEGVPRLVRLLKLFSGLDFVLIPTTYLEHLSSIPAENVRMIVLANQMFRAMLEAARSTAISLVAGEFSRVPALLESADVDHLVNRRPQTDVTRK